MAHFEIINNKATRIAAAHLNELRGLMFDLSNDDEQRLNSLLGQLGVASLDSSAVVSELNGPTMVFDGILDFPSNKAGFVSSNTVRELVEKSREGGLLAYLPEDDDELRAYNALWVGIKNKFIDRWKFEVDLFHKFSAGQIKKSEVKAQQRLLHSASLAVLGQISDKELASSSFRKKWLDDPTVIADLVNKEVFGKISTKFWDDGNLILDNTSNGRKALRASLERQMV